MEKSENKDEEYPELEILKDANFTRESEINSIIGGVSEKSPISEAIAASGITGSVRDIFSRAVEDSRHDWNMPVFLPPSLPPSKEKEDEYQSSATLLRTLHNTMVLWKRSLPEDMQPAILAILYGGIQISVDRLIEEGFHGIRIEGVLDGSPCMILAHQSTVQLLCLVIPINEKIKERRPIGFVFAGKEQTV